TRVREDRSPAQRRNIRRPRLWTVLRRRAGFRRAAPSGREGQRRACRQSGGAGRTACRRPAGALRRRAGGHARQPHVGPALASVRRRRRGALRARRRRAARTRDAAGAPMMRRRAMLQLGLGGLAAALCPGAAAAAPRTLAPDAREKRLANVRQLTAGGSDAPAPFDAPAAPLVLPTTPRAV